MKAAFFSILLLFIISIGAYLYIQPKGEAIYGRALVLAFIAQNNATHLNLESWRKLDLTLKVSDLCENKSGDKLTNCVKKKINKALDRIEALNKKMILVADENYLNALSASLQEIEFKNSPSVIFLNPEFTQSYTIDNFSKLLVINDSHDNSEHLQHVRKITSSIRNQDNWVWSTLLVDDGAGLFNHPVLPHMISYLINGPVNANYKIEFDAESLWQHPLVNNNDYWQMEEFIEQRQATVDISRVLNSFYAYDTNLVKQWPLETYYAFNLLNYRDSLPKNKQGRFVTFANRKGHKFYLDLEFYGRYNPEFVIGIDDEKNLYRLTSFYITNRYYTWEHGGPDSDMLYSQSLGAFIHFQTPLPREEELPYLQYSSILFDSIEFSDNDPYAHINNISDKAFKVVTLNCLPCHSVDGVGGAAHHLDFKTVQSQPGFAKPLFSYPRSVLENFFFNQTATAKLIGVNPNYVEEEVGKELIAWLNPDN